MFKKGCYPKNLMCEGFFGTIKNEFFYSKKWKEATYDEFMNLINILFSLKIDVLKRG